MSQSFELRIIEDGTHSSDHSCLIGLRFDMADGYQEHRLNKTDLMNLRREIGRTLKELNHKSIRARRDTDSCSGTTFSRV